MGRPPTVTLPTKNGFIGIVRPFKSTSGAYIPMSQKYIGRKVFIRLLK